MNVREFVKRNRSEIDQHIAAALRMEDNPRPDDDERRLWVLNDEYLYRWWIASGGREDD